MSFRRVTIRCEIEEEKFGFPEDAAASLKDALHGLAHDVEVEGLDDSGDWASLPKEEQ